MTWPEVAELVGEAGITDANAARHLALKYEKSVGPSAGRTAPRKSKPEGVSVAEAARLLGVERMTVYRRIDRGELRSTSDELGRTRVFLD